jgi:hypothetical protein
MQDTTRSRSYREIFTQLIRLLLFQIKQMVEYTHIVFIELFNQIHLKDSLIIDYEDMTITESHPDLNEGNIRQLCILQLLLEHGELVNILKLSFLSG